MNHGIRITAGESSGQHNGHWSMVSITRHRRHNVRRIRRWPPRHRRRMPPVRMPNAESSTVNRVERFNEHHISGNEKLSSVTTAQWRIRHHQHRYARPARVGRQAGCGNAVSSVVNGLNSHRTSSQAKVGHHTPQCVVFSITPGQLVTLANGRSLGHGAAEYWAGGQWAAVNNVGGDENNRRRALVSRWSS